MFKHIECAYVERPLILSEYMDRSYVVTCRLRVVIVSLISHPYGD